MSQVDGGRILVTGGTGFLGQTLIERLLTAGKQVRVFQRSAVPRGSEVWRSVEQIQGDIGDHRVFELALRDVTAVIHAAGARSGDAAAMWRTNAIGTRAVARAVRAAGVRRFVHISSAGVYGHSAGAAFTEDSATRADDAYGHSKLEAERAVVAALAGCDTAWVILRPFGIYGVRRLDLFREVQRRKVWLYGPTRTIVHPTHVDDVANATLCAVERAEEAGVRGGTFNVAGERALDHRSLVQLVAQRLGVRPRYVSAPDWLASMGEKSQLGLLLPSGLMPPAVISRAGDTRRARERLSFAPIPLERALEATIQAARDAGLLT